MSGRAATHTPNRRNFPGAKFFLALGLLVGVGLVGPSGILALAQDDVDDRPPLPPTEPKRVALQEKFRIPNPKRAIFTGFKNPKTGQIQGGIEDFKPIATE